MAKGLLLFAFSVLLGCTSGFNSAQAQQQLPDTTFAYSNADAAYAQGAGPQIVLSTTNSEFVERGSLDPLAKLAQSDGFAVSRQSGALDQALKPGAILVIANPYVDEYQNFPAMTPPSAFTAQEIEAVRKWVEDGGSLLLLADHAPLGGGSSELAAAFGFEFLNGHTANEAAAQAGDRRVNIKFTQTNGLNTLHPITSGATGKPAIKQFQAFGGQSFIPPTEAKPLLTIPQGWSAIFTYRIRDEVSTAPRIDASGMSQGSTLEYGKGRVAVFAEAGGFSAQIIDGTQKFGFNTPEGRENPEFILSTLRWLARYRE